MSSVNQILGENGSLSQLVDNFQSRKSQIEMAKAVEQTIKESSIVVAEAGTGTGKTFAYLVPALLANKKTVVSTGTKNLQDQLFYKDLPLARRMINRALRVVLLKGRANYLCLHRLETHASESLYSSKKLVKDLAKVEKWAQSTDLGDIAELDSVSEDSAIWPYVTSNNDNCLGNECPCYAKCKVVQARKKAMEADVVVINHHLFFADISLKQDGFGELLPNVDVVVFDEAHQLPETATHFFSERLSSRQINELAKDTLSEYVQLGRDLEQIPVTLEKIKREVSLIRDALGESGSRDAWDKIASKTAIKNALDNLLKQLQFLEELLKEEASRSKGMESAHDRCMSIIGLVAKLANSTSSDSSVRWYETFSMSFSIYITPINISEKFKTILDKKNTSWIFTSATLTANNSFEHFTGQMGIEKAKLLELQSPFDYQKQAILYMPRGMQDTKAKDYIDKMMSAIYPLIQSTNGRAFLLFTSYYALDQAKQWLVDKEFNLFVQGSMTKRELVNKFIATENAVLLGTSSFWEGVDVPGSALSCVVIDKLPFGSPQDPIFKAKAAAFRKQGIDSFNYYQLPQAIISLKQGIGRLIRNESDTGVLVICDPRLVARNYGAQFLRSLPEMRFTRELETVTNFVEEVCIEIVST